MHVTVIIATFNGADKILRQLNSIVTQTRLPEEVIISDDCSNDDTVRIVQQFIKDRKLNNWKVTVNERNIGFKKNFEKLIGLASNDVIFLSDQDDEWFQDKIETMMLFHEKYDGDAVLVSDVMQRVSKCVKADKIVNSSIPNIVRNYDNFYKVKFSKENLINRRPGWSFSFSRSYVENIEKYMNVSDSFYHDEIIWYLGLLKDSLYYYKKNTGIWYRSIENKTARKKYFLGNGSEQLEKNGVLYNSRMRNLEILKSAINSEFQLIVIEEEIIFQRKCYEYLIKGKFSNIAYFLRKRKIKQLVLLTVKKMIISCNIFFNKYVEKNF